MSIVVETYRTAAEAGRALLQSGARYLAGGTLVMAAVNAGTGPRRLVRSTDPALSELVVAGDSIRIGAAVTMARVLAHRDLAFLHPAARAIGGPQVRVMGTVGGNLFAQHPYGDFAVALLALGARVIATGQSGARPLSDLLRDRDRAGLVTHIDVPRPRDPRAFGFLKAARVHPRGAAIIALAAHVPREGGRVRGARIAYGGMGPAPALATSVERALEGNPLDATTIARAASVAAQGADPPTDALATGWYRREVVGVHLRRLLERLEHV